MDNGGNEQDGPCRVLLVYYSYTGQARKVLEAAGEVFRERGCEVHAAPIEFTDPRYAQRFSRFPMEHMWRFPRHAAGPDTQGHRRDPDTR